MLCISMLFLVFSMFHHVSELVLPHGSGVSGAARATLSAEQLQPFLEVQTGFVTITTSTAQGGGGSFKNRKPIGEVGCCESRMAERIH